MGGHSAPACARERPLSGWTAMEPGDRLGSTAARSLLEAEQVIADMPLEAPSFQCGLRRD